MGDYQNIYEFTRLPFGKPNREESRFRQSYEKMKRDVTVKGYVEIADSYYIHIEVPSESKKGYYYDVVIRFFDPETKNAVQKMDLTKFKLQFFSNSPSFIYQYAVLYNKSGYLIELLMEKQDPLYRNRLPKNNKGLEMDKSIYMACRYLLEHHLRAMTTVGLKTYRKKSVNEFIQGIRSFDRVRIDQELIALEKKLQKETKNNSLRRSTGYDNTQQVKADRTRNYQTDHTYFARVVNKVKATKTAGKAKNAPTVRAIRKK